MVIGKWKVKIKTSLTRAIRIQQQFIAHGLPAPVFENFQHGFRVVVTSFEQDVVENVVETLSANQEMILEFIKKNPFISANKLSGEIGISQRKIQENIQKLKELNKLKRIGPDKGGHWIIL